MNSLATLKNAIGFGLLIGLICTPSIQAADKKSDEHREHGAHVHGSATASIAFDNKIGQFEFKSPSDSIFGFEHIAKSAKDIKTQNDALKLLELKISEIVNFESNLECQFSKEKIEVVREAQENHSETVARFKIICLKSPLNSKISFHFQKFFPKLHDVDLQILVDSLQKSFEANKDGATLELSK